MGVWEARGSSTKDKAVHRHKLVGKQGESQGAGRQEVAAGMLSTHVSH